MTLHNSRRTAEERKTLELRHRIWILIPSQNMDGVIRFGQFKGARKKNNIFLTSDVFMALLVEAVYLVKMLVKSPPNLTVS
jgi:hypothetical protein